MKVVQPPNAPIIVALVAAIVALIWPDSIVGEIARAITAAALLYWAYLEITSGINWIRRLMGAVVFGFVLVAAIIRIMAI